ncbi:hypothetical protein E8E14_006330 [Neopestalotiopsis sp. 37M]|nr:hypothetical protein E8E14_006330 [Neopestalotiopsis sp. 37M]
MKDEEEISHISTVPASLQQITDPNLSYLIPQLDLSQSDDVCGTICQKFKMLALPTASVLYIDHMTGFRHVLGQGADTWPDLPTSYQSSSSLRTILKQPVATSLSIPDQLQIALALARGMLQLNPSPWWRSYWSLEDIYYFPNNHEDMNLATILQTLHISAEIDPRQALREEPYVPWKPSPTEPQDVGEAQLLYGIRNMALYSLGVALLQIDRWCAMNADDVVTIRRRAHQTSRLGPRFQEVVQKCVDCDFGQGADLENPSLRNAVYSSVICEIEDLVRRISQR